MRASTALIGLALSGCGAAGSDAARIEELELRLRHAEAGRLLALAELALDTNPGEALQLAVRSADLERGPRTDGVLQRAMDGLHERRTLLGHRGAVLSVVFSADGSHILSAGDDGVARVWRTEDGACIAELVEPDARLIAGAFSPDGRRIVTRSTDAWYGTQLWDAATGAALGRLVGARQVEFTSDAGRIVAPTLGATITVWDAGSGQELRVLEPHAAPITVARPNGDGTAILSAAADGSARLTSIGGTRELELRGHRGAVTTARFDPGRRWILTASTDRTARLWNLHDGSLLHTLGPCDQAVTEAAFNADGTLVVTACTAHPKARARQVDVWETATGRLAYRIEQPQAAFAFAPTGELLTAAVDATDIAVRAPETGRPRARLAGHSAAVTALTCHPSEPLVVSASLDGTARLWRLRSVGERRALQLGAPVLCGTFGRGDIAVFAGTSNGTVAGWSPPDHDDTTAFESHDLEVWDVDSAPDGARIVTASHDGTAIVWDVETGLEEHLLEGHDDVVCSARFSPDGARVLTASFDGTAALWDAASGERVVELRGHEAALTTASYDPAGHRICSASDDHTARLWGADGRPLRQLQGHGRAVNAAAFNPEGTLLVTASDDRTARVWKVEDGVALHVLPHDAAVLCATFAAGGQTILTGDADGVIRTFDTGLGIERARNGAHGDAIQTLVCNASGTRVLSASRDADARMWDAVTGEALTVFTGRGGGALTGAWFDHDGARALTTSLDGRARIWPVDRLSAARRLLPRPPDRR